MSKDNQITPSASLPFDALSQDALGLLQRADTQDIFPFIQQIRNIYLQSRFATYVSYAAIVHTALLLQSDETRWLEFQRSACEYYKANEIIGWPPKPEDSAEALRFVAQCVLLPTDETESKKSNKTIRALGVLMDEGLTPDGMVAALQKQGIKGYYARRTKRNKPAKGQRARSSDPTCSRSEHIQLSTTKNSEELNRNLRLGPRPFRVMLEITSLDRFTRYAFQQGGSVHVQLKQPSRGGKRERVALIVPGRILTCE